MFLELDKDEAKMIFEVLGINEKFTCAGWDLAWDYVINHLDDDEEINFQSTKDIFKYSITSYLPHKDHNDLDIEDFYYGYLQNYCTFEYFINAFNNRDSEDEHLKEDWVDIADYIYAAFCAMVAEDGSIIVFE